MAQRFSLALSILLLIVPISSYSFGLQSKQYRKNNALRMAVSTETSSSLITASDVLWTPSWKSGARDLEYGPIDQYCSSLTQTLRRPTRTVHCGPVKIGSEHPYVRQTMATTLTSDVEATMGQIMKCADTGFDLVRITVQGRREADACMKIREGLFKKGYDIPLCADMHFQPKVAMMVADAVEKIRINPGNFVDGTKDFDDAVFETELDYNKKREYLTEAMAPLVEKCRSLNRAMRIGTNHGSLSSRVLSFYGDTPRGMVESALEFADICRALDYHNFVFSMKASNPMVMVQSYRLLAAEMYRLGWDYPLHLGVTEAGEGEDGRMKSAIGIGTLLSDGLGDTVRVSLTEDPEYEYAPCNRLTEIAGLRLADTNADAKKRQEATRSYADTRDITSYAKRTSQITQEQTEDESVDVANFLHKFGSVISVVHPDMLKEESAPYLYKELGCKLAVGMPFKDIATVDSILMHSLPQDKISRKNLKRLMAANMGLVVPAQELEKEENIGAFENVIALMDLGDAIANGGKVPKGAIRLAITVRGTESDEDIAIISDTIKPLFIILHPDPSISQLHSSRRLFELLKLKNDLTPVIHQFIATGTDSNELALQLGSKVGSLLTDGNGDGILIEAVEKDSFSVDYLRTTSFSLLQGCRMRNVKTEFVSCPSCGRTLFDLQDTTAEITAATGHLPGVTVAVMGCIVNGPGEMADADFGYVGTIPGKVDLYYGKEVVKKGIKNAEAVEELVNLIKEYDMWKDKPEEEE